MYVRDVGAALGCGPQMGGQDSGSPCPGSQLDQSDETDPAHPNSLTPPAAHPSPTSHAPPDQAADEPTQSSAAAAGSEPPESPAVSTTSQADPKSAQLPTPNPQPVSLGPGATLNASTPPRERSLESLNTGSTPSPSPAPSPALSSAPSSPRPPPASPERPPSSQPPVPAIATAGRRLGLEPPQAYHGVQGNDGNHKSPSPVPEGHSTPTFPLSANYYLLNAPPVPYTGYTAVTIPSGPAQPPLPEKRRSAAPPMPPAERGSALRAASFVLPVPRPPGHSAPHHVSFCAPTGEGVPHIGPAGRPHGPGEESRVSAKFVQDSSRFWYKPTISRDQGERTASSPPTFLTHHILRLFLL